MVFLELRRDSRVTTGISGFLLHEGRSEPGDGTEREPPGSQEGRCPDNWDPS